MSLEFYQILSLYTYIFMLVRCNALYF